MKIVNAQIDHGGYLHFFLEDGKEFCDGSKRYLLEWGAVLIIPGPGLDLPDWTVDVPAYGGYPPHRFHQLTTDPVILCTARRARSLLDGFGPSSNIVEVPGLQEAFAELQSGRDAYGQPWPIPQAQR